VARQRGREVSAAAGCALKPVAGRVVKVVAVRAALAAAVVVPFECDAARERREFRLGLLGESPARAGAPPAHGRALDGARQLFEAAPLRRHDGDYGRAERGRQLRGLDFETLSLGEIDHRQRDDDGAARLKQLRGEVEVAFEVGGVDDGDYHVGARDARRAAGQHVARDALVERGGVKAVEAGQVDEPGLRAGRGERPDAFLALDRHAGVVGDLLPQTRQGVEQARLARVRVARERHRQLARRLRGLERRGGGLQRLAHT
jgi:hypothetical protein